MIPSIVIAAVILVLIVARLLWILPWPRLLRTRALLSLTDSKTRKRKPVLLSVLGSGGHTMEMLHYLRHFHREKYSEWHFVVAETDRLSAGKVNEMDEHDKRGAEVCPSHVHIIPRSREVGQPWISSFFSTMKSLYACVPMVFGIQPDYIICNGPGTCIPVCMVGYIIRFLGLRHVGIIYVESVARVQHLSLSGKILYYFADQFIVQWARLKEKYPSSQCFGML